MNPNTRFCARRGSIWASLDTWGLTTQPLWHLDENSHFGAIVQTSPLEVEG